eukprot:4597882-Pyramimonas_sp.AAC.1
MNYSRSHLSRKRRANIARVVPRGAALRHADRFRAERRGSAARVGGRFLPLVAARHRAVLLCVSLRVAVKVHKVHLKCSCAALELRLSNACSAIEPRLKHA